MNDTRGARVGGYRWTLAPGMSGADVEQMISLLLPASDGPPCPSLALRAGERPDIVTVIKHAPHRTLYRLRLPGLDLHVKHYGGGFREWCRCLLRGRRAARELALSREAARRGVPTLEVLGCGESPRRSDSWLITRTLPEVVPLLDVLETDLPANLRHRLAHSLGAFLARLHEAGVRHDDLHPGNLLLRLVEGEPRLYLIDLDMARLGAALGWPASRANLVVLDRWFALRFTGSDRLRAFRAYCDARPELALDARRLAGELAAHTSASLLQHTRKLDRRCLGGNRHFVRLREPGARGYAVRGLAGPLPDDTTFTRPDIKLLKRSASSVVVELPGGRILKRVPAEPLASLFRTPPALRSYRLGHAFLLRGLPTPRPVAVWHRRRFGLCQEGYLLVEKVPDALHLRGFVEMLAGKPTAERNARLWTVLDELGRLVRRLHEWRYSHRDLKAANLLVSPIGAVMSSRGLREVARGGDHVWLIDLVGVRRLGKVGRSRRVRDLARLHMSFLDHPALTRTDRLRLLRAYLPWCLHGGASWKGWWTDIDREGRAKAARNRARGRVVG